MKRLVGLVFGTALVASVAAAPVAGAPGFPDRIDLPNGFAPEGITAGRGTTLYVGSLANGEIRVVNARTGNDEQLVAGAPPGETRVAVGTEYDARSNRLWVAGGPTGQVRVYDASTGELLETYQFAAGFLNDLVVTRDAVYVTDSGTAFQHLNVIPLGPGGSLPAPTETFQLPLSGDIVYTTGFNANGIVAARGWLILVQSNTGKLFRVDPATGDAQEIDLGGASVSAGDGLELRGSTLYVVRNQLERVAVFKLGSNLESARLLGEITSSELDIPTTAAFAAGRLWAVNARFGTAPGPTTEYWITKLPTAP
jgi:streptogramin lyase